MSKHLDPSLHLSFNFLSQQQLLHKSMVHALHLERVKVLSTEFGQLESDSFCELLSSVLRVDEDKAP